MGEHVYPQGVVANVLTEDWTCEERYVAGNANNHVVNTDKVAGFGRATLDRAWFALGTIMTACSAEETRAVRMSWCEAEAIVTGVVAQ